LSVKQLGQLHGMWSEKLLYPSHNHKHGNWIPCQARDDATETENDTKEYFLCPENTSSSKKTKLSLFRHKYDKNPRTPNA